MAQLSLIIDSESAGARPFDREGLKARVAWLASLNVFVGTSSWKYQGWLGQLYDPARYEYRGKIAASRFERDCLAEFAEVFKTVCVDAAYYTFPTTQHLKAMAAQVPSDFRFTFKVTDDITIKTFPNLPRFGARAGRANPNFLNAEVFKESFLKPCESIRGNVGVLIFEFSRFDPSDFINGREFVDVLDPFLAALPKDHLYGIETRNRQWLQPEYFSCLRRHGVTHVFNSWTHMPAVVEQLKTPDIFTNPGLVAARFLLKPGRGFEQAVKTFSPYDKLQDVYEEGRQAVIQLLRDGLRFEPRRKTFVYINNRFEGSALATLEAILRILEETIVSLACLVFAHQK